MRRLPGLCLLLLLVGAVPIHAAEPPQKSISERSIDRYRQALKIDPGNLPLHYFLGVSLLIEGENQQAIEEFRASYPGFADSAEANYNLALAYSRLGDADSALLYLERADELGAAQQPDLFQLTNLYFNLALSYIDADQPNDAIRLLHRVIARSDNRHEARHLLGKLYLGQGQEKLAAEQWQMILAEHPEDTLARESLYTIHFNAGLQALQSKQTPRAREAFLDARKLEPDNALCGYYLGYLAYQDQDYPGAIRLLTGVAATIPEDMQSSLGAMIYNSAAALLDAGAPEQARPAVAFLAASPQTEVQAHYLTGNIHLALRQYPKAREQYLQVLKLDPSHVGANLNLQKADQGTSEAFYQQGRALYRQGDLPAAIDKLKESLRINPGHGMARSYLDQSRKDLGEESSRQFVRGKALLDARQPRQALEAIRRGLYLHPEDPAGLSLEHQAISALKEQIHVLLTDASSLRQAGSDLESEKVLQQVLQLEPENTEALQGIAQIRTLRREKVAELVARSRQALEDGRLGEARSTFQEALGIEPENTAAAEGLERTEALVSSLVTEEIHWARRAREVGQFSQAEDHFRKALQLRDDEQLQQELADLRSATNRQIDSLLQAVRTARKAREINKARSLLAKAESLSPTDPSINRQRKELETDIALLIRRKLATGKEQAAAGNNQAALVSYRRVLDLDPGNAEAGQGLQASRAAVKGQLLSLLETTTRSIDAGDYTAATSTLKKAGAIDPYNTKVTELRKRLDMIRSSGLEPKDMQRLYLEGIELYTGGHYQDAIRLWQQVLTLQPQHEKARLNIEKAQRKLAQIKAFKNG